MALDIESEAASYWGTSLEEVFFARRQELFTPPPPPSAKEIYQAVGALIPFTILGLKFQGFPVVGQTAWSIYKPQDDDYDKEIGFQPNGRGWSGEPESSRRMCFPSSVARTILVYTNYSQNS